MNDSDDPVIQNARAETVIASLLTMQLSLHRVRRRRGLIALQRMLLKVDGRVFLPIRYSCPKILWYILCIVIIIYDTELRNANIISWLKAGIRFLKNFFFYTGFRRMRSPRRKESPVYSETIYLILLCNNDYSILFYFFYQRINNWPFSVTVQQSVPTWRIQFI